MRPYTPDGRALLAREHRGRTLPRSLAGRGPRRARAIYHVSLRNALATRERARVCARERARARARAPTRAHLVEESARPHTQLLPRIYMGPFPSDYYYYCHYFY